MILTALSGYCLQLDINSTDIPQSSLFYASFLFDEEFQVFITDPGRALYHMVNPESMKGDTIKSTNNTWKIYSIRFEEIHWTKECTNYGEGATFKTYTDCVAGEHKAFFWPMLGCSVPWMSGPDHHNSCKGIITLGQNVYSRFWRTILEIQSQVQYFRMDEQHTASCLKQCVELKARSTLQNRGTKTKWQTEHNRHSVYLQFPKTVKVKEYHEAYGLFDLVVEVGSSLGLWIGLSCLGVFDLLLQATSVIKQHVQRMWK